MNTGLHWSDALDQLLAKQEIVDGCVGTSGSADIRRGRRSRDDLSYAVLNHPRDGRVPSPITPA